jgi:hypothetical protein
VRQWSHRINDALIIHHLLLLNVSLHDLGRWIQPFIPHVLNEGIPKQCANVDHVKQHYGNIHHKVKIDDGEIASNATYEGDTSTIRGQIVAVRQWLIGISTPARSSLAASSFPS